MLIRITNFGAAEVQDFASSMIPPVSEHPSPPEHAMVGRIRSLILAFTKRSIREEMEIAAWVLTVPILVPLSSCMSAMAAICDFGIMIPTISFGSWPTIIAALPGQVAALVVGSNSPRVIRAAVRKDLLITTLVILSLIAPIFACSIIPRMSAKQFGPAHVTVAPIRNGNSAVAVVEVPMDLFSSRTMVTTVTSASASIASPRVRS